MNVRKKEDLIYIYNKHQSLFYINDCNVKAIDIGVHKKTKKIYVIFVREDTNEAYRKWLVHIGKILRED